STLILDVFVAPKELLEVTFLLSYQLYAPTATPPPSSPATKLMIATFLTNLLLLLLFELLFSEFNSLNSPSIGPLSPIFTAPFKLFRNTFYNQIMKILRTK